MSPLQFADRELWEAARDALRVLKGREVVVGRRL
jgi:hypothetical protein